MVDIQWGQVSLLRCSCHVQHSHTKTLFLTLMGVWDLYQAIDKVVPPLHTETRVFKVYEIQWIAPCFIYFPSRSFICFYLNPVITSAKRDKGFFQFTLFLSFCEKPAIL